MTEMFDYFVGYDKREVDAYHVCVKSAVRRSSAPLRVHALMEDHLRATGMFWRTHHRLGERAAKKRQPLNPSVKVDDQDARPFSTEFAFTRFLVPELKRRSGWALFTDCDFMWLDDPMQIMVEADPRYAVMVVKHMHVPREAVKMDGQSQQAYRRKNWSSLCLWNCAHPANRTLTLGDVNDRPGSWLHAFEWLADDLIGGLDGRWNHLVGVDGQADPAHVGAAHFTLGGPWMVGYEQGQFADLWRAERDA